nr:putative tartrate dehydrogenase/decarboxylase ttuc' [Quercus suber]
MLVDAMTVRMVNRPESLDVVVATNLHADVLSDLAAALAGSIGIAPSSNLDPTRQCPSMFEPIHGSAPDIAGQGIANPVGAFWSAAEMVRWVGKGELDEVADQFMTAIETVTGNPQTRTKDMGGSANTIEVTEALLPRNDSCLPIFPIRPRRLSKLRDRQHEADGFPADQAHRHRSIPVAVHGGSPVVALDPHMPLRHHDLTPPSIPAFALGTLAVPRPVTVWSATRVENDHVPLQCDDTFDGVDFGSRRVREMHHVSALQILSRPVLSPGDIITSLGGIVLGRDGGRHGLARHSRRLEKSIIDGYGDRSRDDRRKQESGRDSQAKGEVRQEGHRVWDREVLDGMRQEGNEEDEARASHVNADSGTSGGSEAAYHRRIPLPYIRTLMPSTGSRSPVARPPLDR